MVVTLPDGRPGKDLNIERTFANMRSMGFENPDLPWSTLERRLSDGRAAGPGSGRFPQADGGDSPAWSRKRSAYEAPPSPAPASSSSGGIAYAELHCHSNFSFLDGASHPEELVEEAVRLGLSGLALTDHNGFYGIVRFAEAARAHGLPAVFGAELSLDMTRPDRKSTRLNSSHT